MSVACDAMSSFRGLSSRVDALKSSTLVWMCDPNGKVIYLNARCLAFTGSDFSEDFHDAWTACIHPGDLTDFHETLAWALKTRQPFSNEYRLLRNDGVYRSVLDIASPTTNADGSFGGFLGSAIDVTDQKLAHAVLETVSGRLIEAQERERARIARELHDDICQKLALLSLEIQQTKRRIDSVTGEDLEKIREHCVEIAADVQSLSHQLHCSKLDYLGISVALRGFCREFAQRHEVTVDFLDGKIPTHLQKDISLGLFRIAQEALHNAVKHSGTHLFVVELRGSASHIQLIVKDAGKGFDVAQAKGNRGLGLVSMQERAHLVRGSLVIESRPGAGTKIIATIPLPVEKREPPIEISTCNRDLTAQQKHNVRRPQAGQEKGAGLISQFGDHRLGYTRGTALKDSPSVSMRSTLRAPLNTV